MTRSSPISNKESEISFAMFLTITHGLCNGVSLETKGSILLRPYSKTGTNGLQILTWTWRVYRNRYHAIVIEQTQQQYRLQALQWKIYRQRGWIFFRDSPGPQPTLPTMENIVKEHDSLSGWVCLEQEKKRRRSQNWQDYWAGRSWEYPLDPDSPANQSNPVNRWLKPRVSVSSSIPRFFSGGAAWWELKGSTLVLQVQCRFVGLTEDKIAIYHSPKLADISR